jgi:hypothetical protein
METSMRQRFGHRRGVGLLALLLALPLLVLGLTSAPASAANVVNVVVHVPADVVTNTCSPGDVVNLHGNIHIVISTTTDGSGGYHVIDTLNSQLRGETVAPIQPVVRYVSAESQNDSWYTGTVFPAVHTQTYDWTLVSQSGTPNYVLHMTMHETVTANGVPTATVDNWRMDCEG